MSEFNEKELHYKLDAEDYIQYYLYYTSTEPNMIKTRKRSRMIFMGILILIGIFFSVRNYNTNNTIDWPTVAIFGLVIIAMYFLRVRLEKRKYQKVYEKHVSDTLSQQIQEETSIHFSDSSLYLKEGENLSIIPFTDINRIIEVENHFYITLADGTSIILPKQMDDSEVFKTNINQLIAKGNITFIQHLDWKW